MKITRKHARQFLIRHHQLDGECTLSGKQGIIDYVQKVGCIQFDPLNVVGYNPELVLQSRIVDFNPGLLYDLLYKDRYLYDTWDKNMSICLVSDWPYFERIRNTYKKRYLHRLKGQEKVIDHVRRHINDHGPVTSGDFEHNMKINWPWGPTRMARAVLESMFFWGELIIFKKLKTRKIYDFSYNHIEKSILDSMDPNPLDSIYFEWFLKRRIRSVGILRLKSSPAFLGIRNFTSPLRKEAADGLLKKGEISELKIEGIKEPFFIAKEDVPALQAVGKTKKKQVSVFAPLDNLLWDRSLIKDVFNFDYVWEVYKPVSERKFGYYVLPIIYGDRFIARFEPAQDKKKKALIIKNWWWENGINMNTAMENALITGFTRFLDYLNLEKIIISKDANDKNTLKWTRAVISGA